jgi:EmrB/QacA subfamily drug resistance transporter
MGAAVNIALPKIGLELNLSAVSQAWIISAYLLTASMFLIPFGKIGDMYGRKKIFLIGNIVFMAASFLCAFSNSGITLVISRLIQGFGGAMMVSTSMALLILAFPAQDRGKIIGYSIAATYLGLSCAPLIGGMMTQYLGWRSLFLLNGLIGIGLSLAVYFKIKTEWIEENSGKFDITGSIIILLSISSLMYGFSKLPNLINIILTAIGIIGIIFFIYFELKLLNPVLEIRLFTENKTFFYSTLTALINYAATYAITFVLSLYLQNVKGFEPREAGLILISQPIMMALISSFSGHLSDKRDPRILASIGMAIIVVGLFLLTFIDISTSVHYISISLVILGIGFGLFSSPNTNSAMSAVETKFYGVASATISTMRSMGMMFSMAIASMTTFLYIGNEKITNANMLSYLSSMKVVLIIFTILCFIGIFTSLAGIKKKEEIANNL